MGTAETSRPTPAASAAPGAPPGRFAFPGATVLAQGSLLLILALGAALVIIPPGTALGAPAASGAPASAVPTCGADRLDAQGQVEHVIDGDTVILADGRHVRLVGIDTPELGRDGAPDEPLAAPARRLVQTLAGAGAGVGLRYDRERRDHHGRTLAHLYTANGRNLQAALLEAGLATTLVVPPNLWSQPCYAGVEAGARQARRGLWQRAELDAVEAGQLPADTRGPRIVRGTVSRIGASRRNIWLNLGRGFAVRVPREALEWFPEGFPAHWAGRRVEVRGQVYRRNGELRVTVRHPAALTEIHD